MAKRRGTRWGDDHRPNRGGLSRPRQLMKRIYAIDPEEQTPTHAGDVPLTDIDFCINCATVRRDWNGGRWTRTNGHPQLVPHDGQRINKQFVRARADLYRSGRGWRAKWKPGQARAYVTCVTLGVIDP